MDRNIIRDYYQQEVEAHRLEEEYFKLEGIRTKEIIERYLDKSKLEILDIGGGAGYYSFWLQEKGHELTLVDLSPKNIELARKQSEASGISLKQMETGDAINLPYADVSFDIVLMMGPLYHLTDRSERIKAISEAKRVLKPGGILLAAIISRYASLIDGIKWDLLDDDVFFDILKHDLKTGNHVNETGNMQYFTMAYFHTLDDIKSEIYEAGLQFEKLIPVESVGWIIKNFSEKEKDEVYMKKLMEIIAMVEANEELTAMSPHIIAIAKKG